MVIHGDPKSRQTMHEGSKTFHHEILTSVLGVLMNVFDSS